MKNPDFVTSNISQELKQLGFNDPCFSYYTFATEKLCLVGSESSGIPEITHEGLYHT